MSLPAAKNVREGADEDGNKITAINIWGSGDVTLVMPDEAAIEACVRQKLTPEQTADSDIVFSTIFPCAASAPATAQPIPVKASVEISIFEPPSAMVNVKRTYAKERRCQGEPSHSNRCRRLAAQFNSRELAGKRSGR